MKKQKENINNKTKRNTRKLKNHIKFWVLIHENLRVEPSFSCSNDPSFVVDGKKLEPIPFGPNELLFVVLEVPKGD